MEKSTSPWSALSSVDPSPWLPPPRVMGGLGKFGDLLRHHFQHRHPPPAAAATRIAAPACIGDIGPRRFDHARSSSASRSPICAISAARAAQRFDFRLKRQARGVGGDARADDQRPVGLGQRLVGGGKARGLLSGAQQNGRGTAQAGLRNGQQR